MASPVLQKSARIVVAALMLAGAVSWGGSAPATAQSLPQAGVPLAAASSVAPLAPSRLLDTRPGEPTVDGEFAGIGRRGANTTVTLQVTGRAGVPKGATAAMLNLTSVSPSPGTAITAFPCGIKRPAASNLNVPSGDIRANGAFVKLAPNGTVCIHTASATDLIVDINGFVPADGTPVSVNPARVLDTRRGFPTVDGLSAGTGPIPRERFATVKVAGRAGVPNDASAVLLNVTSVLPQAGTAITVFACSPAGVPVVSNLNVPVGDIRANNVFVELSAEGTVCAYTTESTDLIIDVNGFVPAVGSPRTIYPSRLMDTRPGFSTYDQISQGIGLRGKESETVLQVAGRADLPFATTAALLNVTVVQPNPGTVVKVYPCGSRPDASNVNVPAGDIRANNVFVKLSPNGTVCLYTANPTHLVVDVNGFVVGPANARMCTPKVTPLPTAECKALISFFNATGGSGWRDSVGWNSYTDPCGWRGVRCAGGHVDKLLFDENRLTGSVPAQIGDLKYLTTLDVSYNSLTSISPEVGKLSKLQILAVNDNKLTKLPTSINKLVKLTLFDASSNKLAFDVTSTLLPLKTANKIRYLQLYGNGCLKTTNAALATWLASFDPAWNDGC